MSITPVLYWPLVYNVALSTHALPPYLKNVYLSSSWCAHNIHPFVELGTSVVFRNQSYYGEWIPETSKTRSKPYCHCGLQADMELGRIHFDIDG
jgi:hypothetical protein